MSSLRQTLHFQPEICLKLKFSDFLIKNVLIDDDVKPTGLIDVMKLYSHSTCLPYKQTREVFQYSSYVQRSYVTDGVSRTTNRK